jgi:hypothetical protein
MKSHGAAAVAAVKRYNQSEMSEVVAGWEQAVRSEFPESESMQNKGCPRGAFLGLCSEGLVAGIPTGDYTASVKNRRYAVTAARLIRSHRALASNREELWRLCTAPASIQENGQLDVVLALWEAGFLVRSQQP